MSSLRDGNPELNDRSLPEYKGEVVADGSVVYTHRFHAATKERAKDYWNFRLKLHLPLYDYADNIKTSFKKL